MEKFTEEILKASKEFKEWIHGRVALIHNTYADDKNITPTYIVLHSEMGKWTITRFFMLGLKIQVSVDYTDISTEEVFKLLLNEYSNPLN